MEGKKGRHIYSRAFLASLQSSKMEMGSHTYTPPSPS